MRPVCWNILTEIVKKYARDTLIPRNVRKNATLLYYIMESTVDSND